MKKSFSLLLTIVLITLFSYISISIIEKKSLSTSNITTLYLDTQAKLHMEFFENYIYSLNLKTNCYENISFEDSFFYFEAKISYEKNCQTSSNNKANIDLVISASSKLESIRVHKKFVMNF